MLLATSEGVSVILVMLVVGLIFLGVTVLGELSHMVTSRRKARRTGRRSAY